MKPSVARSLAAAAILALPAAAWAAAPQPVHVLSVALPDGSVARIRYVGDVPPVLTVQAPRPVAAPVAILAPVPDAAGLPGADPSFAALERMQLLMQRQAAAMMVRADLVEAAMTGTATNGEPLPAAFNGSGCVEGTRITRNGDAAPQVVSFRSAGCGGSTPARPAAIRTPDGGGRDAVPGIARPRSGEQPRLVEASAEQAAPLSLLR